MKSCDIIPTNKQPLLVELLYELQLADTRSAREGSGPSSSSNAPSSGPGRTSSSGSSSTNRSSKQQLPPADNNEERIRSSNESKETDNNNGRSRTVSSQPVTASVPEEEEIPARMEDIEEYLEKLYEEDTNTKAEGAKRILTLALRPENLPSLVENETLMGALSRVLKDDYRKSTSLTLTFIQIFFCIARFKELHTYLLSNRIGDVCMRVVDLEERRHAARMLDAERIATLAMLQAKGDTAGEAAFRKVDAEARAREEQEEALENDRNAGRNTESKQNDEDAGGRRKRRAKRGQEANGDSESKAPERGRGDEEKRPIKLRPLPDGRVSLSSEKRRTNAAIRKSEGLTYVCLSLLMHLAEDLEIERKMCNRGIVGLLTPLLERDNAVLLLLTVNFLRKLSIFEENKDAMVAQGAGTKLISLLPEPPDVPALTAPEADPVRIELYSSVLHLCFNLTFDVTMCQAFVTSGALRKVGAMLRAAPFRATGLKLLYRLSTDVNVRGQFAGTDAVAYTLSMAAKFPQARLPPELAALAINLAMHQATAESMTKADAVKALVQRLAKTGDPSIAKILRSLSQYSYGLQADSELKSHAMEDLKRELARNTALLGSNNSKTKNSKNKKKIKSKKSKKRGNGDDGKEMEDTNDDTQDTGIGTSTIGNAVGNGTYMPEPDTPIPYDYPFAGVWSPVVKDLVKLVKNAESNTAHDVLLELFGIFSNLTPRDYPDTLPCAALTEDEDFMGVITRKLNPAAVGIEADLLLEAVQVVSALALDPVSAPSLATSAVPRLLADVLGLRTVGDEAEGGGGLDPDLTMQTVNCVARLLHHHETRHVLVCGSKVPARLAELLDVAHDRLAAEVDDCVYIMIEHDREYGTSGLWQQLQAKRFALYNREWLQAAENPNMMVTSHPTVGTTNGPNNHHHHPYGDQQQHPHHNVGDAPDAYVAEDEDYEAEPPAAEGEELLYNNMEQARSPLHHMGKHGEAVAFDVSYLYQANRTGPESRPLVSDRPGIGAPYDYVEDVDTDEDEQSLQERIDENDEEDDIGDDVRALMDQYMHAAPNPSGGQGARGMLNNANNGSMGTKGLVSGGVQVRGPVNPASFRGGYGVPSSSSSTNGLDAWETDE